MRFVAVLAALVTLSTLALPAPAFADAKFSDYVSEVKVGVSTHASSWLDNDEPLRPWLQHDEGGVDIGLEALFHGPDFFKHIWTPRIQLGASTPTRKGTSHAYTGLYWDRDISDDFYIAGFFGLAIHDGITETSPAAPSAGYTRQLGSRVLFRFGPEIGYHLTDNVNLSLVWAHLSHGYILQPDTNASNEGLDQLGIRLGYEF